jgi:hypothetical protein
LQKTLFILLFTLFIFTGIPNISFASGFDNGSQWTGTYTATQGETNVRLIVTKDLVEFDFRSTANNSSVPTGSYTMKPTFDAKTGKIYLKSVEWINHPSNFEMVDLDGTLSGDIISGSVLLKNSVIGHFTVKKESAVKSASNEQSVTIVNKNTNSIAHDVLTGFRILFVVGILFIICNAIIKLIKPHANRNSVFSFSMKWIMGQVIAQVVVEILMMIFS